METIGIDIGTTTISLAVYESAADTMIETLTIANDCFLKNTAAWEKLQDVPAIINKAKTALDTLLKRHPKAAAIGLTGQMHGILYVDSHGECISPLYTWQDQRANLAEFDGKSIATLIQDACGITVPAGYGLATHCYASKKNDVPNNAACLCTIPDYLGMVLTGRKKPLMHTSMAASLGFFDSAHNCFLNPALETMGIDRRILPEVTAECSILGYYKDLPVTAAFGDNQASFLGTVGQKEDTVLINMGTGGQISLLSSKYFQAPGIEARPFGNSTYLLVGASLCGGKAYAMLEQFFRAYAVAAGAPDCPQYAYMAQLAELAVGEGSIKPALKVVTAFTGTRLCPDACGSIQGIREENFTPGHLILGVLTGMARELFDLYQIIRKGTGIQAKHILASGNGLCQNRLLQQIFQEMFHADLQLSKHQEAAACGAAMSSVHEK